MRLESSPELTQSCFGLLAALPSFVFLCSSKYTSPSTQSFHQATTPQFQDINVNDSSIHHYKSFLNWPIQRRHDLTDCFHWYLFMPSCVSPQALLEILQSFTRTFVPVYGWQISDMDTYSSNCI